MFKKVLTLSLAAVGFVGAAHAADMRMPMKAPPMMAPIFSWTGFYIGVNGGGGFGAGHNAIVNETFNGATFVSGTWPGSGNFGKLDPAGGFGGGQIGYNYQVSNWVFGVETDIQGANIKDTAGATLPYIGASTITANVGQKIDWFGTVRGRLGIAFDRVLVYGTAGFAYGQTTTALTMSDTLGFAAAGSSKSTKTGWVAGGGVEWAFAPNWSVKGEYQYIDLGRKGVVAQEFLGAVPTLFAVSTSARSDFHTGRIGINYRF